MAEGFEGLEVYQEARTLRARMFRLSRQLPAEEKFVLVAQMRRAALSVTNNIAEGHGSRSYRHNVSYLYRSRGSVNELLDDLREQARAVVKLINGFIRYLRKRMQNDAEGSCSAASSC